MVQLAVFVFVLALVYALKAVSIARTHDDLAGDGASFSWMSARAEDEATAASWAREEERAEQPRMVVRRAGLHHVGA